MPPDSNLDRQPPPKRRKHNPMLPNSLDFTAKLTSLLSDASVQKPSRSRTRSSKTGDDVVVDRNGPSLGKFDKHGASLAFKDARVEVDQQITLSRTRLIMEEKARRYAAMKRGDYVTQGTEAAPLIDFDRKWADTEEHRRSTGALRAHSSDSDHDSNEDNHYISTKDSEDARPVFEYEDEFGRLRKGTKAEIQRLKRQHQRSLLGEEELERMSARPVAPANLIYGDAVQTLAFEAQDPAKMEALARKRDRSATPPDKQHYDADSEIRTKGTGFYKFSKDENQRAKEMQSLEGQRKQTEEKRLEQNNRKAARHKEIEERRKNLGAMRARKMADSFLEGLEADMRDRST